MPNVRSVPYKKNTTAFLKIDYIKSLMCLRSIEVYRLAIDSDINEQTLQRWISHPRPAATFGHINALAKALKVEPTALMETVPEFWHLAEGEFQN